MALQQACANPVSVMEPAHAVVVRLTMPFVCLENVKSRKIKYIPKGKRPWLGRSIACAHQTRYVEMPEQQQSQLVAGLRALYSRPQKGEGWLG